MTECESVTEEKKTSPQSYGLVITYTERGDEATQEMPQLFSVAAVGAEQLHQLTATQTTSLLMQEVKLAVPRCSLNFVCLFLKV